MTWASKISPGGWQAGLLFAAICLLWAAQTKIEPDSWNDASRLAAVQTLVERNTWHIENTDLGDWTGDKIFFAGHFYSSKPPLLTALTTMPYRVIHSLGGQLKRDRCRPDEVCAYYWLSLLLVGLPAALLVALFYWQSRRSLASTGRAMFLTGLFTFGTMIWPFSLVYNNHIPATVCLFGGFLLLQTEPSSARMTQLRLLMSGLLVSLAVNFELTTIFLSAALAVLAFIRQGRAVIWFVVGGLIPLLATLWLDYQMIGSLLPPYFFSEGYNYPGGPFSASVGGTVSPDNPWRYAFRSLLGDRGLLLYSPLMLWAIAGLVAAIRNRRHPDRMEGIILGLAMLAQALFIYLRTDNFGGKAYGARYFIVVLPFLFYFLNYSLPADFRSFIRSSKGKLAVGALAVALVISVGSAWQGSQAPWQTIQPPLFLQTRPFAPPLTICSNLDPQACLDTMFYPCGLAEFGLTRRRYDPPAMTHQVQANFGNQVMLLGYDLPASRLGSRQDLALTLYWQSLAATQTDYVQFNHLLDRQLAKQASLERLPGMPYTTACWQPGEVIVDRYDLPLDAGTPAGVYTLLVGLYPQEAGYLAPLPLVQGDDVLDSTSVNLGLLKVGGPPPDIVLTEAEPDQPLEVSLGQVIALRGFDLTTQDEALGLRLYWQSLAQTGIDYTVFVHVLNGSGAVVAQTDRPPLNGIYPTSLWDPGEIVADEVVLPIPPDLPPDDYTLHVGLYNFADGTRLPVPGSADNSIVLTKVELHGLAGQD